MEKWRNIMIKKALGKISGSVICSLQQEDNFDYSEKLTSETKYIISECEFIIRLLDHTSIFDKNLEKANQNTNQNP